MSESKKQLRALVRARERQLPEEYRSDCARRITRLVMDLPEYRQARCVFCFVGTRREIDTTALLRDILAGGKRLCVPLCVGDGIMQLKEITALEQLSPGAYGILEPPESAGTVPLDQVDLSIIPCLSCDHQGRRLGQGGGYYDRMFASGTDRTVMLCRERLMLGSIPTEPLDRVFPLVVTETGVYRDGKAAAQAPLPPL